MKFKLCLDRLWCLVDAHSNILPSTEAELMSDEPSDEEALLVELCCYF